MILAGFINHFWLIQLSHESAYNLRKFRPEIVVVLSTSAICFLFGSAATIDTGIMNKHIHTTCASFFFRLMILSQLYNTFISWKVYANCSGKMSEISMFLKVVLCGLYGVQLWVGTRGDCFTKIWEGELDSKSIFLEYTLALSVLSYTFLMAYDVRKYKMVYRTALPPISV